MRLILHIGTPKTGTTSIQKALYADRERLSSQGIYLLEKLGKPNNKLFSGAFEAFPNAYSQRGNHSLDSWKKHVDGVLDTFRLEVTSASKTHHTVLVTSEQLSRRLNHGQIEKLASFLRPMFESVLVVCSVRDQVRALPSLYWLSVRTGKETRGLKRFVRQVGISQAHLHYDALAEKWGSVFGFEHLHFLFFQDGQDWDAVQDFYSRVLEEVVGRPASYEWGRRNVSGSVPQTVLLRFINMLYIDASIGSKGFRKFRRLKKLVLDHTGFLRIFRGNKLNPQLAREVEKHFHYSNTRFSHRYLDSVWPPYLQENSLVHRPGDG